MKKNIFGVNKAIGKSHPHENGARLISLDYNYTKEYNYNYEICVTQFNHLFSEVKSSHRVAALWLTPQNYIQKFKKSILILTSLLVLPNLAFSAGIPVVDVTANQQMATQNAKQVAEWAKDASRWTETVAHYQKQIQAYKDELLSKTGIRDSVTFLKDIKQIYSDFAEAGQNIQSFYNDVLRDPQKFLSNKGNEIFGKYTSFDRCNFDFLSQSEKNICKMNLITYAAQVETYNQASIQVNIVAKSLEKLHQKLIESKDIKETNGINNAINVEKTKLEIIKTNLEISNMHYENQRRIRQDQAAQLFQNQWGKSL
ncbi:type IV secretion system protein [Campylobacter jejuni]|uniref:type IV secretion system protein n=1 Tax=Campylobacter jejuni TaxID=197 RepID=UPI0005CF54C5|nr:type IV secretion system protein [Campylobacter jejuni]KJD21722.1 type IV secretion system protein [Campylobacter jejuni subsp. jejuni]MCW1871819.1 type IV secretion system protein [Campylobacter jejuni]OEV44275.1 type IV secretion system protein [Campylobacter jejuni]OEV44448.1 type IV secretion system protein [Campylobacter jejuni]OEV46375.1 type IV secretion system protein [Campylobacter jejuni]